MRRTGIVTAAAVTLAIAASAPATHAATAPMVGVAPNGDAQVGWLEGAADWGYTTGMPTVTARSWSSGGALTDPDYLSGLRSQVLGADMAVGGTGAAFFVWRRMKSGVAVVEGRRRAPDGSLGPVLQLSSTAYNAYAATVAADATGNAVFVWWRNGGPDEYIQARRLSASGVLGPSMILSAPGNQSRRPDVAMGPNGNALVVWDSNLTSGGPNDYLVKARSVRSDGTLGPIEDVTGEMPHVESPQVAMDGAGNAIVAWIPSEVPDQSARIDMRRRSAAGVYEGGWWTVAEPTTNQDARDVRLAMNASGDAMFAWTRFVGNFVEVQARYWKENVDEFGNVLTLSSQSDGLDTWRAQPAIDANGNSLVAWENIGNSGRYSFIQARRRASSGVVGSIETVAGNPTDGPEITDPVLAMAPGGTATFLWKVAADPDWIVGRRRTSSGYRPPIRLDGP